MLTRNRVNLADAEAASRLPGTVALLPHTRIFVIANLVVTLAWRTGGQRGRA